jgi:ammonia channel protein AmtB
MAWVASSAPWAPASSLPARSPGPRVKGLWFDGNGKQVLTQLKGIVVCLVWSGVMTWVILIGIKATIRLRVTNEQEIEGLDLHLHGERVE